MRYWSPYIKTSIRFKSGRNKIKVMTAHLPHQRILVIVGNDLIGDSRVQKIIRASVDDGNETWVLSRRPNINKIPEGLGNANFVRVKFDADSPLLELDYELHPLSQTWHQILKRSRRGIQIARSGLKKFIRSTRNQLVYRTRRSIYHLKRSVGKLAYSSFVPRQLHGLRTKLLSPRRARMEIERAEATRSRTSESFENRTVKEIVYPDFSEYLDRMFSWFVKPAIKIKPNLIHANDADTLRIAMAVKDYWKEREHHVAVVYDAHEYTAGVHRPNPSWKPAMLDQESKYISRVDAVVTVSETIAAMLMDEFNLAVMPSVVLNAPSRGVVHDDLPFPTLRHSLALGPEVPLFTYVGVSAPARGIHTVIEALVNTPKSHFALVTKSNNYVVDCLQTARDLGVSDRVHLLPYVPHQWVSAYIADSTAGMNPAVHHPNHELSCFTKFYEYLHARLPIVTSDVKTMAHETVTRNIGTVFVAENSIDCARAMDDLFREVESHRLAITVELINEWSWEVQAQKLSEIYAKIQLANT